ncbi:MAG: hypothetical protein AB7R67_23735 [Vicinamibacterales bacterium]
MTTTVAPALELYDVVFNDPLGPRETSIVAASHDDAADQVAALYDACIESSTRRHDGDYVDHALAATFHFAQQLAGPDGEVIEIGDWFVIAA